MTVETVKVEIERYRREGEGRGGKGKFFKIWNFGFRCTWYVVPKCFFQEICQYFGVSFQTKKKKKKAEVYYQQWKQQNF